MNYFHYTPGHFPLSTANCHGEKITLFLIYKSLAHFLLAKNEVVFLVLFVQYFQRTLIMM